MADVAAIEVGNLAQRLAMDYGIHEVINNLVRRPGGLVAVQKLADQIDPEVHPTATIERLDGTALVHHSLWEAVHETTESPGYVEMTRRAWLGGALLTLGDAIKTHGGLDKGPDLELVRHLRNGVAHGNRFRFDRDEPRRPAYFVGFDRRGRPDGTITPPGERTTFAVDASMQGAPVLFDFMAPGDVCDLLFSVGFRLLGRSSPAPPSL